MSECENENLENGTSDRSMVRVNVGVGRNLESTRGLSDRNGSDPGQSSMAGSRVDRERRTG